MPARLLDSVKADGLQPAVAQHQTSAGLDAVLAEGHATRFQGQALVPAVPEVVLAEDAVLAEVRLAVLALHLARWDVAQAQVEWLERHASSHPKLQLLRSELERERPR